MNEFKPTKVGQFMISSTMAILLAETVTRTPDEGDGGWERRESVVLALIPENERTPFVTWIRVISERAVVGVDHRMIYNDVCSFGDYHKDLVGAMASFAMRSKEKTQDRADEALIRQRGSDDGWNAASWIVDGNTDNPVGVLKRLIDGIEAGDPEILDELPMADVSGQHADRPTWEDICNDELGHYDSGADEDLLDTYEESFGHGVERRIRKMYEEYNAA